VINQIFNVVVVAHQEVEELFNRIDREQNGKLDVLVNNAYAGKLSNPEYIHLKVNETKNYKKTFLFYSSCTIYSAIFLLQFFELIFVFPFKKS
jgi:NAD(P)-dependent dehydrogenase (short-subunit alcohol dehydrogenase family)